MLHLIISFDYTGQSWYGNADCRNVFNWLRDAAQQLVRTTNGKGYTTNGVKVRPGQVYTSLSSIAVGTGLKKSKVYSIIERFLNENQTIFKRQTKQYGTLFTLLHSSVYDDGQSEFQTANQTKSKRKSNDFPTVKEKKQKKEKIYNIYNNLDDENSADSAGAPPRAQAHGQSGDGTARQNAAPSAKAVRQGGKYESYLEWFGKNCRNLRTMKQMSADEFWTVRERFGAQAILDILLKMDNYKDTAKKNRTVYRTMLNWLKRDGYKEFRPEESDSSYERTQDYLRKLEEDHKNAISWDEHMKRKKAGQSS